ncbi:MAG TPA: hypothetical protein VGL77_16955 [Armatimonadota bacterium]|jgi:hypothetical protein
MPLFDACLADLDERISPDEEKLLFDAWAAFVAGRSPDDVFTPRRTTSVPPKIVWPVVRVNATLDDSEAMALQQLAGCSAALSAASGQLLCVRANYGTCILPSLFGAELFIMEDEHDTLPTNRPLPGGMEAMRALLDRGMPDLRQGLGGKVLDMGAFFAALAARYPNIGRSVHVYHPDLQGPMDVCELLWGSALFVDIYDEPELVHAVLQLITDTYIHFMQAWEGVIPPLAGGVAAHWGMLHQGRLLLRDDSATNFSPAMYDEFIRPYNAQLFAAFGGGAIHFCGHGDHFIKSLAETPGISAVQMSQPHLNDTEAIFRHTIEQGINLLDFSRVAAEEIRATGRKFHGRVHVQ